MSDDDSTARPGLTSGSGPSSGITPAITTPRTARDRDRDRDRDREQRRAPRFSWTLAIESTFFQSLCESVQLGLRENNTFKPEAWDRALDALIKIHGAEATKSHLINKADNARKRFRLWRGLREHPDFSYNPVTHTVTASDAAWKAHIEREPLSRALRGRPFEHEDYMEILYPDVVLSGGAPKRLTKSRRRGTDGLSPPQEDSDIHTGNSLLDLQADSSSQHLSPSISSSDPRQTNMTLHSQSSSHQGPPAQLPWQHIQFPNQASSLHSLPLQHNSTLQQSPLPQLLSPQPQRYSQPSPEHPQQQTQLTQRPTSTTISSRTAIPVGSALTPPDETAPQTRKRGPPSSTATDARPALSSSTSISAAAPPGVDKRRRTTGAAPGMAVATPALRDSGSGANGVIERQLRENAQLLEKILELVHEKQPRWSEQAMDIFLHDFADEDMDLQVKIAEKVLADENKAMAFCKMPAVLREHWVKRLREINNRTNQ